MNIKNYSDDENLTLTEFNEEGDENFLSLIEVDEEISIEEQIEIAEGVLLYCIDLFNKKLPENYRDQSIVKFIPLFAILYDTSRSKNSSSTISLNLEKLVKLISARNRTALKAYIKKFGKDVVRILCDIVNEINREPSKAPKPEIVKQLIEISQKHKIKTDLTHL